MRVGHHGWCHSYSPINTNECTLVRMDVFLLGMVKWNPLIVKSNKPKYTFVQNQLAAYQPNSLFRHMVLSKHVKRYVTFRWPKWG